MGTEHTTKFITAAFPGKYIQGAGALSELPALMHRFGEKGLMVASPTARKLFSQYIDVHTQQGMQTETFRGECSRSEIERLLALVRQNHVEVLAGMGGGKALDTAKIVADKAGIPVIIIPTIASTDAPCSGCAVIYSDQGVFESIYYQNMNPQVVLVDTRIITASPVRFLVSGMGDALATWFEARSCVQTCSTNECGGYSTQAGLSIARLCYDTLLQYGPAAKLANERGIITPALDRIIEANILLSGIGFESSGLAAAHSIHNGLTALDETHAFYHGEKVAFGVLAGLHLTDALPAEMDQVYSFCETIGLPTTFAALGITDTRKERLMEAARKACAEGEGIHHEVRPVSPERVLNALLAADAMGRKRV